MCCPVACHAFVSRFIGSAREEGGASMPFHISMASLRCFQSSDQCSLLCAFFSPVCYPYRSVLQWSLHRRPAVCRFWRPSPVPAFPALRMARHFPQYSPAFRYQFLVATILTGSCGSPCVGEGEELRSSWPLPPLRGYLVSPHNLDAQVPAHIW